MNIFKFKLYKNVNVLALFFIMSCCSFAKANEFDTAQQLFETGNYNQSIYYYLKHIKSNPLAHEVKVSLSEAYIKTHKYDKAIKKLDEVTAVILLHEKAITLRAHALAIQKKWLRLLVDAESLVQINPINKQAYMYMDMAYVGLGDQQSAAESMARYKIVSAQLN